MNSCTGKSHADKSSSPAGEGQSGYLSGQLIYPLDNNPTDQCHASTIEETPSGLVAAWFGGPREGHPEVGIWVSRYIGERWTAPVEVVNGVQNDSVRFPCWNPVLFQPSEGPLILFFKVGPSPREWWGEMITLSDEGRTWSEPEKLGTGRLGPLIGPVKNKPVQLDDGTILCPSSTERIEEKGPERIEEKGPERIEHDRTYWQVHFESTAEPVRKGSAAADPGRRWTVTGPVNDGIRFDAIQPSILTYGDERMQILCRTRQGVISQSWSEDGGKTWGPMTATSLPNPNAGTDAVTLSGGRQLLVYNHTTREGGFPSGRNMLNVALSSDGTHWDQVLVLERDRGEFSYPAVIQASDGLVHITYTCRRRSIMHVILDPEKLQ